MKEIDSTRRHLVFNAPRYGAVFAASAGLPLLAGQPKPKTGEKGEEGFHERGPNAGAWHTEARPACIRRGHPAHSFPMRISRSRACHTEREALFGVQRSE